MRMTRIWLLLLLAANDSLPFGSTAGHLFRLGRKAERHGSFASAYLYYSQAAAANPRKLIYRDRAEAVASLAALEAKTQPPVLAADKPAPPIPSTESEVDLSPEAVFDSITARELAAARQLLPPPQLDLPAGVQDFDFNNDYKSVFTEVAERFGLQVVFDGDYVPKRNVRYHLRDVTAREALHDLEAVTGSIVIPLGPKLIMVAEDTDAKRKNLEQVETASIPVPNALTVQELTEIGQAIKQAVGVEKVYWSSTTNEILVRDRVSRVLAAQSVLHDLLSYRTQVAIELDFMQFDQSSLLDLGVDLQTSFPISFLGANKSGVITLAQLAKFSATHLYGVGITNMDITAVATESDARTILKNTIVSVEGQKATFHVGDKYPIVTSQFVGSVNTGGRVFSPTPSFTFEDLGLVVNVTPHVHSMGEVSLDLDAEFKILGAYQQIGIPIISNRKLQTTLRLKGNEWAVVGGLVSESESRTRKGPAFLSQIPYLGNLVNHFTRNKAKTYIVLAIKPRVLSMPPDQKVTHRILLGSETRTLTPL